MTAARTPIPWAKPFLYGNERTAVLDALESTWISGGPYVSRLEAECAERMGVRRAIATSNGTTSLHLALLGLGIGPGDEVIVPGFTFVAPVNMVLAVGATPVFVDVEPDTWLMDPSAVRIAITSKTRAVIPVHLYGNVADMKTICAIAQSEDCSVIEDAAEATFSRREGRYAGTVGHIGSFSFHATKTITTGEGGLVVTNDDQLADRMLMIRDHGMRKDRRYWHDVVGFNFRMTNLSAAIGCGQLENLSTIFRERSRLYGAYTERLQNLRGIQVQAFPPGVDPVLWTFGVRLEPNLAGMRDAICKELADAQIETRPGFYFFGDMPPYNCPDLPVSREVSRSVILLPTYPQLTDGDVDYICQTLRQAVSRRYGRLTT